MNYCLSRITISRKTIKSPYTRVNIAKILNYIAVLINALHLRIVREYINLDEH